MKFPGWEWSKGRLDTSFSLTPPNSSLVEPQKQAVEVHAL